MGRKTGTRYPRSMQKGYLPQALQRMAAAGALMLASYATLAGSLTSGTLITPLDPGHNPRLTFAMPPGFAADQQVWLVYELVALFPEDEDSGEVGLEQAFEGVMTPLNALYVNFRAGDMDYRKPEELRRLVGAELSTAYESVNAGGGRVRGGRVVSYLSAPGKIDVPLLVSVERAQGMRPLALRVTVGQGQLPPEYQPKPQDTLAYRIGYAAGLVLFGWLVVRFIRRRLHLARPK